MREVHISDEQDLIVQGLDSLGGTVIVFSQFNEVLLVKVPT